MEDLYRPRIIRFSQVHTVIDELNGIDSYQIKVSEDARFGQGRNIHWARTPTVLQKLLDWQFVPFASSNMRLTNPISQRRQCSLGQLVVMCDFATFLIG